MIEFHELAMAEAREAQAWYADRSHQAAKSFLFQFRATVARIVESPDQFASIRNHFKYARIFGFPYIVVFRSRHDGIILIVAIAHTSRRSGFWKDRE